MATESNRLPRYKRVGQDRLPFRLQDRDREILTLVYNCRILTSRHIQCLTPGSDKGILSRLQKLYHAGYLDRLKLSNLEDPGTILGSIWQTPRDNELHNLLE